MAPRKLKIETKKMSKASSNRLHCLIRKGSELTTLCDIEGCIVVFDDDRLITAESWSKQNDVHQILKKYHQFVEEQRRKELKKVGVKSKKVNKSTGRHCDDRPSSNGCVSDASQPHFGVVSNVNADASVVLEDMEMHMGIDNMAGQLEDADIFESLPDNGALVEMEKQLENLISSEYVDPLPEMGFKDMVGQFEEDTQDYLLSNFDFDGIVGQSAMEISSHHGTLPDPLPEMGFKDMLGQFEEDTLDYLLSSFDFNGIVGQSATEISTHHGTLPDPLPEMGFKAMVGQFEEDTLDYLLSNFDFDGIVGQSAFEISSHHGTLPGFASDYSLEDCSLC
ncbi:Transcription factor, MADS-box [Dillenia turbinata]|uniref:Transcription factor, MADS-box n=1 Tax=Dillenia turbinata TaxID=194707 RepID=A0AAN8V4R1_9MAGN